MSSPCHRPTPRTRGRTSSPSGGGRCSGSSRIRASRSRRPGTRSGSCSRAPARCAPSSTTACSPATRTTGSSSSGFHPRKYRSAGDGALKVLLVTRHFPPGGGGGVQRPLTLATPVAIRLVRREGIDVVLTTSPPPSLHLLGAAVKRTTGAAWVADLRDPLTSHPHRRGYESQLARLKEKTTGGVGRLVASQADAIVAVSDAIAEEVRALEPKGKVVTIANGSDFDDFAGLEYHSSEKLRITHAGHFHGKRDPKPFLRALADSGLADVVARFAGDFRAADREYAESLGLGDGIELLGDVSRRRSLELQRDSEVLLLLIPESGGRGRGVLTGKIFEYLAAERPILAVVPPDGAAAKLVRDTGAGVVVPSDDVDALREALLDLHRRWRAGSLDG